MKIVLVFYTEPWKLQIHWRAGHSRSWSDSNRGIVKISNKRSDPSITNIQSCTWKRNLKNGRLLISRTSICSGHRRGRCFFIATHCAVCLQCSHPANHTNINKISNININFFVPKRLAIFSNLWYLMIWMDDLATQWPVRLPSYRSLSCFFLFPIWCSFYKNYSACKSKWKFYLLRVDDKTQWLMT